MGRELLLRQNSTRPLASPERCTPLHQEFTADALALMDSHSRLDTRLWMARAQQRVTAGIAQMLQRHTTMRSAPRILASCARHPPYQNLEHTPRPSRFFHRIGVTVSVI